MSRQIKALEEQLGIKLSVRERQTIRLTLAGDGYAREITEALRRISSASFNLQANPHGGSLNLAILPTFGTRWLAPRLSDFLAKNPGVTVNLATRFLPFDFRLDSIDAAIHFGQPRWPGAELEFLMSERVAPACNRAFRDRFIIERPSDLLRVPLLHLTSRPNAWNKWFSANGMPSANVGGMLFDQFATAAQAAIAGLGIALLPTFLVAEDLKRGYLILPFGEIQSDEAYYLAFAIYRKDYPSLVAFKEWILDAAGNPGDIDR